ncbi:MAG: hypothetical protein KC496_18600 [Anaerolineae bacterium]|nr:hypothetical protein [Anaerolineae bacterium]
MQDEAMVMNHAKGTVEGTTAGVFCSNEIGFRITGTPNRFGTVARLALARTQAKGWLADVLRDATSRRGSPW